MATWDFVMPYDEEVRDWLERECYPHPPVRQGNRYPTTGDLKWALAAAGISPDSSLVIDGNFDWNNDAFTSDSVRMRGELLLELNLLIMLSERCGQFLLYPESGGAPVLVERTMEPDVVARLHEELSSVENGWRRFFAKMYSPSLHPNCRKASVMALALSIDKLQTFDHLPILADALEEAGCTNAYILDHCRGPGPHVRGCWVVDLVLRKN